ncbi:hypothetical protein CFK37_18685 [Virgibacillus phasianinus]|uniref:Uncharacterized protein n=2 Tax=Virgibacillus phasianinus TaxID=2017483 RepID=A0A220U813_9BACI|nr:hypothetical protein CFK37_18685 [Virgibacillus phasianinus]
MLVVSKLMAIGVIIFSMLAGFIFFYIVSDLSKAQKKRLLEEMISQLINFMIFIWLGKVLLNLSIFIKDPLAILAYPSNSNAFYLAVLFSAVVLAYKSKRRKMDVPLFMESFLPVFLVASFFYEFIQLVWHDRVYSLGYIILLTVLLITFLLVRDRISGSVLLIVMLCGWSAGVVLIAYTQPFATVFGYLMDPWFVGLFFIVSILIIIFNKRKRDRNGWN